MLAVGRKQAAMPSMTVGEIKRHFSEVLDEVQAGTEFQILYGRAQKPVARIVPIADERTPRRLGILKGKCSYVISDDFKFADETEFLGS
jgi:prevent-host-death family protein